MSKRHRLESIALPIARNTAKPCSVPHCRSTRHKLHRHCLAHSRSQSRWGNPLTRRGAFRVCDLHSVRLVTKAILKDNPEAIAAATKWVGLILESAAARQRGPGRAITPTTRAVNWLVGNEVDPAAVVKVCVSVMSYAAAMSGDHPEKKRLTVNLGIHTLKLAPTYRKNVHHRRKMQAGLGELLYSGLNGLLIAVYVNVRRELRDMDTRENLYRSLKVGPP